MKYDYRAKDERLSFDRAVALLRNRHDDDVVVAPYINHQHPDNVDTVANGLRQLGISVTELIINRREYDDYFTNAEYDDEYYNDNIIEKSLEHFICIKLLNLNNGDVFIDIASEHSPLCRIITEMTGCEGYMQDIMYPSGIDGNRIGGDAANLPVEDGYFSAATATCSFEHFEGDADIKFMREMSRVLRPGGKVIIVPLYLYPTACYVTDPIMSVPGGVPFDERIICIEDWGNRHARFYSAETLYRRIIKPNPGIKFDIFVLQNHGVFGAPEQCYCRFILIGEKRKQ